MLKIIIIMLLIVWLLGSAYMFSKTWKQIDILLLSKIVVIAFWPAFVLADLVEDLKNRKKDNEIKTRIDETSIGGIQNKTT